MYTRDDKREGRLSIIKDRMIHFALNKSKGSFDDGLQNHFILERVTNEKRIIKSVGIILEDNLIVEV